DRNPDERFADHSRQDSGGESMRAFTNANPRDLTHALTLVRDARQSGRTAAIAGGGSDLLGMMKERLIAPDVLVNLKAVGGLDDVSPQGRGGVVIGGLITLDALGRHPVIRRDYAVLAEAARSVATAKNYQKIETAGARSQWRRRRVAA